MFTYDQFPALTWLAWFGSLGSASFGLDSVAGAGGATVAFTSSDPSFMVPPATVTIPAGASSAVVAPLFHAAHGSAVLTASYRGVTVSTTITKSCAPPVSGCSLNHTWDYDLCRCVLSQCSGTTSCQ